MKRNFINRVYLMARRMLNLPPPLVRKRLQNMELVVRDGTIRAKPDYDDAWVLACAMHSRVIFDVGANVGYDALLTLSLSNVERVVLIEANSLALITAAENLIRNHLSERVNFINAFASDADDTEIEFWTIGTGAAGSMYRNHAQTVSRKGHVSYVPTVTVDTLQARLDLIPDFIKIDVEGAEHKVLNGCVQCVSKGHPRLLIEMHSNPNLSMSDNAKMAIDWCRDIGYQAWYLNSPFASV